MMIGLAISPGNTALLAGGGGRVLADAAFGLIGATADGSTGQTYTLDAAWTDLQWYRMALAAPNYVTPIAGANSDTYVATEADEGYRLAVTGMDGATEMAAKALHVVLEPPVLLEAGTSTTGWDAPTGGGVLDLDGGQVRLTGTGTINAQVVKQNIGSFDPSILGTVAYNIDVGMDAGRQTMNTHRVVLRRGGVDQYLADVTTLGNMAELAVPYLMGDLWHGYHVSEVSGLATSGVSSMGLYVRHAGNAPFVAECRIGPILGKSGGRPTVTINFDDNKASVYSFVFPLFQSLGFVGGINNVATTAGNPSALDLPKILEMYAAGWDVNLDSTHNDDITSSFGTMAAAGASWQIGKDYAVTNGITRGNEHGCWTGGQIESNPASNRVSVATVNATSGSAVVTMTTTQEMIDELAIGMRVVGHSVPNSPETTIANVSHSAGVGGTTTVTLSANVTATQTKPMLFVDTSPEFYTMKTPVYYRDTLGLRTMRTTRAQGGMLTRYGFGDRGMFTFGNALHSLTYAAFTALIDLMILRGMTIDFYTHGVIPGGGGVESDTVDFEAKMNYLALKRDQGLLDVLTKSQIWARDGNATVPTGLSGP